MKTLALLFAATLSLSAQSPIGLSFPPDKHPISWKA
jgi:hypothetical protein